MHQADIDEAELDAQFSGYDVADAPGFSIGIALKSEPVYRRGFGSARLDPHRPLSASSQMRMWSVTKHFTCFAILLLAERRLLSIDHPVRTYIEELPDWAAAISLRQLMGHISGMRCSMDILQLTSAYTHRQAPTGCQIELMRKLDTVDAQPGAKFSYNNGGYRLLSEVIARTSGQSFADFLTSEVLEPVGMKSSFICASDRDANVDVTPCYSADDDKFIETPLESTMLGEGGLVSTVDDMLGWMAHMDEPIIGSPESWLAMRSPMRLNNGASTGYAMGLMVGSYRGLATIGHSGAGPSGSAQMIRIPDVGLDIVVMANRADVSAPTIAAQAIDMCVNGLAPSLGLAEPPAKGIYVNRATTRLLELDSAEGTALNGSPLGPLLQSDNGRFWAAVNVTLGGALSVAADGDMVLLDEFGLQHCFEPLSPPIDDAAVDTLGGCYVCGSVGATARVERLSADLARLHIDGPIGDASYDLTRKGQSIWIGRAVGNLPRSNCLVEFDEDTLWLSSLRTTRLCFNRLAVHH